MEGYLKEYWEPIEQELKNKDARIKCLEERNKVLEDEHYKDIEIQHLKRKIEDLKSDMFKGFYINKDEWDKIHEFIKNKTINGSFGGTVSYIFIPTSIGTIGKVECYGEKFTFRELG